MFEEQGKVPPLSRNGPEIAARYDTILYGHTATSIIPGMMFTPFRIDNRSENRFRSDMCKPAKFKDYHNW